MKIHVKVEICWKKLRILLDYEMVDLMLVFRHIMLDTRTNSYSSVEDVFKVAELPRSEAQAQQSC